MTLFLGSITINSSPPITIELGRFVLFIEEAIVENAQTGQVIRIQIERRQVQ